MLDALFIETLETSNPCLRRSSDEMPWSLFLRLDYTHENSTFYIYRPGIRANEKRHGVIRTNVLVRLRAMPNEEVT